MRPLMLLLLAGLLGACQFGPPAPIPTASPTPTSSPGPAGLPGGYVAQNPADAEMQAIMRQAESLLQAKYPAAGLRLARLLEIGSQVVAGVNYRLRAEYLDARGSGTLEATVYRDLQNHFSLSADTYTP